MLEYAANVNSLHSAVLRPIAARTIGARSFEAYEPIAYFDSADVLITNLPTRTVTAHGGQGDNTKIVWGQITDLDVVISKGTLTDYGLALLTNAFAEIYPAHNAYYVNTTELHTTDGSGDVLLDNTPYVIGNNKMFAYDLDSEVTLDKKTVSIISGRTVRVTGAANTNVLIDYYYDYSDGDVTEFIIQKELNQGYFQLEGRTTLIDYDGNKRSVYVVFPKVSIESTFSFRLGANQPPQVGDFQMRAMSVDWDGIQTPMVIKVLETLID